LESLADDPARYDMVRKRFLELDGRFDEVEAILRAKAEAAPAAQIQPWLDLIKSQADHGRSAEVISKTIDDLKKRARTPRPELVEAQARWTARQWLEADRAYDQAARLRADDAVALTSVAFYYEQTGRIDRALELYRQALRVDPKSRPTMRQMAMALTSRGGEPAAWDEAMALLRPEAGETAEDRLARAVVLARSSDQARAAQAPALLAEVIADLEPSNPTAASARDFVARFLLNQGQADRAAAYAAISAGMFGTPQDLALHAECLLKAGKFDLAEVELDRLFLADPVAPDEGRLRAELVAARTGPELAPAALADEVLGRGKGPVAIALGRVGFQRILASGGGRDLPATSLDAAEKIARALLDMDPGLGWMLGQVMILRGRPEEAIAPCRVASEASDAIEADRAEAGRTALAAAVRLGKVSEAAGVLDAALRTVPNSPELLALRAVVHHDLGEYADEVRIYRRILELIPPAHPQTESVLNNLAWALSEGLNQPEEGLKLIEGLIQERGATPQSVCTRGVVRMRMGKLDEAIADLRQSVQGEATGRRLFHLARAYRASGQMDLARDALAQARRAGLTEAEMDSTERADFQALLAL
jgi:tetratricopeptide (TPR) repeat protein